MADKIKIHSTNYFDTLIAVAEDTKATIGTIPATKGDKKTIAEMQYALIAKEPYRYTSDDLLFQVYADRNDIVESEYQQARVQFFSKGQPCLRTSPLTKTHGFGIHCDREGKVAIYGMETEDYQHMLQDSSIHKVKAMRTTKK